MRYIYPTLPYYTPPCSSPPYLTPTLLIVIKLILSPARAGVKYQDLITGLDAEPSNSIHEFEKRCTYDDTGALDCKPMVNPFSLEVSPGPTSPVATTALGADISLSTAGVASSFVITAKDQFRNRRPGGDTISVLMGKWSCKGVDASLCVSKGALEDPSEDPKTGTVVDNSDGSYSTSYIITAAGKYRLSIDIAGTRGAGSPFLLTIETEAADKSLTYAYGRLQGIAAGKTSELYVQTRDRYGNHIRADLDAFPPGEVNGGTEDIQFELCLSLGEDDSAKCAGGEVYAGVGVTISYSIGPDGKSENAATGDPFYGLYQIIFFPFDPEPVVPRVLHGDKVGDGEESEAGTPVPCLFDTTGIAQEYSLMDPGPELANLCADKAASAQATARRLGLRHVKPHTRIIISEGAPAAVEPAASGHLDGGVRRSTHELSLSVSEGGEEMLQQGGRGLPDAALGFEGGSDGALPSSRRAPKNVNQEELLVAIEQTFVAPDTTIIELWLGLSPPLTSSHLTSSHYYYANRGKQILAWSLSSSP